METLRPGHRATDIRSIREHGNQTEEKMKMKTEMKTMKTKWNQTTKHWKQVMNKHTTNNGD